MTLMTGNAVPPDIVVAIPVKDEAARIGECLRALALQQDAQAHHILLLLNNCTDGTAAIVRDVTPSLPVPVHVVDVALPPSHAHAGYARHLAMAHAARLVAADGVLMTTDADSRVYPDWIAGNLHHLRRGADAVAGRAEIDPVEATLIPPALHEADAAECAYAALLDQTVALLDPDPADPWPRHDEESGASLAVSLAAYRRAGGVPPVPLGEDRAFAAALRRVDARLRHAPEVRVVVSGRIEGRAAGGMADTIRRRMAKPDDGLDARLEAVRDAVRRARLRRCLRRIWARGAARPFLGTVPKTLGLPGALIEDALARPYFGLAWAEIEGASPLLRRRPVPVARLSREMEEVVSVLARLRRGRTLRPDAPADPAGIPARDTAEPA